MFVAINKNRALYLILTVSNVSAFASTVMQNYTQPVSNADT